MGNAFVATADDPSAVYFNPAGLAGLKEPALYLGASALVPSTEFRNTAGVEEETNGRVFLPPHLYLAYPTGNIAYGFGAYVPFGLGTNWGDMGATRYQATESDITTLNIGPAVAVRARPWLLLGGGVNYMRSDAALIKKVDQSLVGGTDAETRLDGDGDGWGYGAGMIVIPAEHLRLGVSYRSAIKVDYNGTASIDDIAPAIQPLFGGASYATDGKTTIEFPANLTIGLAYKPTEKVTLGLDLEKTYWSSYESLDIDIENEVPLAGFTDTSEAKDWRDIWAIRVGVEYRATESISLRGGYVYQNNPVPESTLEPRIPDSDQHDFSFGVGYSASNLVIDAAYMVAYFADRVVDNDILDGEYDTFGHSVVLSMGYKF